MFITKEELDSIYKKEQFMQEFDEEFLKNIKSKEIVENTDNLVTNYEIEYSLNNKEDLFKIDSSNLAIDVYFTSRGRFTGIDHIKIQDFKAEDIESILSSIKVQNFESLFITILNILEKRIVFPKNLQPQFLLLEDLLEVLFSISYHFGGIKALNLDMDCNNCKKSFSLKLNLNDIKFKYLEEIENDLREEFKNMVLKLPEEEYKNKYGDVPKEEVIKEFKIGEIYYIYDGNTKYGFRLNNLSDYVFCFHLINKKYQKFYKEVQNDQEKLKILREKQLEEIERLIRILTLQSVNGIELNTLDKKMEEYKKISWKVLVKALKFKEEKLNFGINGEIKFTCPHCSYNHRRYLRQVLSFFNFIISIITYISREAGENADQDVFFTFQ